MNGSKKVGTKFGFRTVAILAAMIIVPSALFGQQPTAEQRVAALKQSLAQSQTALRKYQWLETTTVSVKGDVKSVKQNNCFYNVDGKVVKTPVNVGPPPAEKGGLRGRIIANKKEEMTDYMQRAVELIHQYVPPDSALIQRSKDAQKMTLTPVDQSGAIRLSFRDFYQAGDLLTITLNTQTNAILGVGVTTWLESQDDGIFLTVNFAQLPDGAGYAAKTILDAKAKNISVVVENNGYRPL